MRKLIWLVILIFLLSGCSKQADAIGAAPAEDTSNLKSYMEEPKVLISSGHQYEYENWIDEQIDFQADSISLQGDSFFVDMIFQDSFDDEKLKKAVSVEGLAGIPEISVYKLEGKTMLNIGCRQIEYGKKYSLIISEELTSTDGKRLKAPIKKEIMMQPDTTAKYTVVGNDGTYEASGRHSVIDSYAVGSMNFSPDPKTVAVDFSSEVDKESVESSVKEFLKDKDIKYSFVWEDPRSVKIKLDGFRGGEDEAYSIRMVNAKDKTGNPIIGDLYFVVGKSNWLGSINIKEKTDSALHRLPDKRYMVVQNPGITNTIIFDDTETKYAFNMDTKKLEKFKIDREYTLGIPGYRFAYSWKNSDDILLLNRVTGQVIDYSILDGSSKELFIIPKEIMNGQLIGMSVSPDGSKLALTREEGNDNVYVFNMNGKLLYKGENMYKVRTIEALGPVYSLQWLDNDTIVLEDNISTENKLDYNVIGININTGKKNIIAEHAYKPHAMPDNGLIKVERFKDFRSSDGTVEILREGKAISSFKTKLNEYGNFFFVDENTLVYNTYENEIISRHLDTGKFETLGNGYIIGLSQDKSKLYYMTNYKMLYYID